VFFFPPVTQGDSAEALEQVCRYGVVILLLCALNVSVTYALLSLVDSTSLAAGWRRLI